MEKSTQVFEPLKIALADLRHGTIGRHSTYVPIGIGYIGSHALSQFEPGNISLRLYTDSSEIIKDIDAWQPDIIGVANYCWNSELGRLVCRYAKHKSPNVLCVMGGPEFPKMPEERREYLAERSEVDIYIYGDGEEAFARLIKKFLENNFNVGNLKSICNDGAISLNSQSGEIIIGPPIPRFRDLDLIPSPYLSGLLDKWLTEIYSPALETIRGCPYRCAYCFAGQNMEKHIGMFSLERIKNELTYIAKKVNNYPNKILMIYDSNFGIYERDVEIAKHIAGLMDTYEWPMTFYVTTGKNNFDRVLEIVDILKGRLPVCLSQQSMNKDTLKSVMRRNISMDEYFKMAAELKKRGQTPECELIVPLPEETKESYFNAHRILVDAGINTGATYTTMLLKATTLASKEYREKYEMKTKFRIIPRQFGEYAGERCFETEEVCIETNSMSFDDYLDCRGFAFISSLFSTEQMDIIYLHLKEMKISFYEYIYKIWEIVKSGDNILSQIYNKYINETSKELFDSSKDIYQYFSDHENYNKLLKGELGDNLLRKYTVMIFLENYESLVKLAYKILKEILGNKMSSPDHDSLEAAMQWTSIMRNIADLFNDESLNKVIKLELPYDVNAWYYSGYLSGSLKSFNKPARYNIGFDKKRIFNIMGEGRNLHGEDRIFMLGRTFIHWQISDLWRKCEKTEY